MKVPKKDSSNVILTKYHPGIERVSVNRNLKLQLLSRHKLLLTVFKCDWDLAVGVMQCTVQPPDKLMTIFKVSGQKSVVLSDWVHNYKLCLLDKVGILESVGIISYDPTLLLTFYS